MTTAIEYALMAGASYISTRGDINKFPVPVGWIEITELRKSDPNSGFEATTFQQGTEIVISYAGTYPKDLTGDWAANIGLGAGTGSDQLFQAADYYLQVKALNPEARITLTGHSLGGGLAALIGIFFGETAITFDQAPFRASAIEYLDTDADGNTITRSAAEALRTYLADHVPAEQLAKLDAYIAANHIFDPSGIAADTLAGRETGVTNINVQGEFLSGLPWNIPDRIGATVENIGNTAPGVAGDDLHSIALLTAFLQSEQSAATGQALNDVTVKLPDLLAMLFDDKLFDHITDTTNTTDENLLERLVKHEAGSGTELPADAMVTRFTSDLWKLAQDGGKTLKDGNSNSTWVSSALTAFAMQKYYEETPDSAGYKKELFTDLATEGGSGGIRFDMADVSDKFATVLARNGRLNLSDAKGFDLYLKYFFDNNLDNNDVNFTLAEDQLILARLPYMRDWFVQAGAGGMIAADTLNRGDFMLGGTGNDSLTGGDKSDLLVGNAGDDTLKSGKGNDTLIGGIGFDRYIEIPGDGFDTVLDRDGAGVIQLGSIDATGSASLTDLTKWIQLGTDIWVDSKNWVVYSKSIVNGETQLLVHKSDNNVLVKGWADNALGIVLGAGSVPVVTPPAATLTGDFKKAIDSHATPDTGDDTYIMTAGNYTPDGDEANAPDLISGTAGNDAIAGLGGDDALSGLAGDDHIEGGTGGDVIQGGLGKDTINGGAGDDIIYGSSDMALNTPVSVNFTKPVNDYPYPQSTGFNWTAGYYDTFANGVPLGISNAPRNRLDGDQGNLIDGGAGNDFIAAGTGADYVHGGADKDLIYGMDQDDVLFGDGDNDWIYGDGNQPGGNSVVWATPENHGNDIIDGGDGDDYLFGQGKDDIVFGGQGNDRIWGDSQTVAELDPAYHGNDYLDGGDGDDQLNGGGGNDTLIGGSGNDQLFGGTGDDIYLNIEAGDVVGDLEGHSTIMLAGATGASTTTSPTVASTTDSTLSIALDDGTSLDFQAALYGMDATIQFANGDTLDLESWVSVNLTQSVALNLNNIQLESGAPVTRAYGGAGADQIQGGANNDVIKGYGGDDVLLGWTGDDALNGGMGNDHLQGDAGDDTLNGGDGNDALLGVDGNDTLMGDAGNDELQGGQGSDTLNGGGGADTLFGQDGSDILNGGVENDVLLGNAGDDVYLFGLGGGQDTVWEEGDTTGDVLRFGADILTADVGVAKSGYDLVLFHTNGTDQVTVANWYSAASYQLVSFEFADGTVWSGVDVGNLGLTHIRGKAGDDVIQGGAGADYLYGLDGADGLYGNDGDDFLYGGAGADLLEGGTGADTLAGGLGNDTYYIDNSGDQVIELVNEGIDTVHSSFSYGLAEQVENLYLEGSEAINGIGNGLDNSLSGNAATNLLEGGAGNDQLNGGLGADTLTGGSGDDYFYLDGYDDMLVEGSNEGHDQILITQVSEQKGNTSYVGSFTLADNIENITMSRYGYVTDATLYGNALDNVIDARGTRVFDHQSGYTIWYYLANVDMYGGAGNDTLYSSDAGNVLDGGLGDDMMVGGSGGDTYYVDSELDQIVENAASSSDSVYSTVTYTLASNLESLYLLDSASINGTGNDLSNALYGNSGDNVLTGGAGYDRLTGGGGNDTLLGGLGNDTYVVSSASLIVEQADEGLDGVEASISHSLSAHLENLVLTGSAAIDGTGNELDNLIQGNGGNNKLTGGAGNDILDGGLGNDTMLGGAGDDSYSLNSSKDVVTEYAGEGIDTVSSSVAYTLGSNVENLVLTGAARINGTGNVLDNAITGNSANNTLNGGAGNDRLDGMGGTDKMIGGAGDDTYVLDVASETVTERSGDGTDTVLAAVTYTLAANVENLVLSGIAAINGTGNKLSNTLAGNGADNMLSGAAGHDILDGGAGADTLTGGTGNDTYRLDRGYAVDTVVDNDATASNTDIAQFLTGVAADQIWFQHVGNNLEASIIGTSDKLVIQDWYLGNTNHVEQFKTTDGAKTLLDSNVQNLVNAMASFAPPAAGQTILPTDYQASLATVIAANWQ